MSCLEAHRGLKSGFPDNTLALFEQKIRFVESK